MNWLKDHSNHLIIAFLACTLFLANMTPGLSLLGWDSLQTELNPWLVIKRSFFSVWEEYQSFGHVAGMGHAADLVRSLLMAIPSLLLPSWLVRYSYHMSMVLIAGLGMYTLLQHTILGQEKRPYALFGAVFYMLHFATIQLLFLPFEPFSLFYGLLPWQVWSYLTLLSPLATKRQWIVFTLITLLATPQGLAQQVFVVLCLLYVLLTLGVLLKTRSLSLLKHAVLAAIIVLAMNSFWLLPQSYFVATSLDVVKESKINQLSTTEVFYLNKDKGNLTDFLSFNGFFYDVIGTHQQPLFLPWKIYREHHVIKVVIYLLSALVLLGLTARSRYQYAFLFVYGFVCLALLSNTEPFASVNELIRQNGFINQIFRSPFTKFAQVYALISSVLFAFGVKQLIDLIARIPHLRPARVLSAVLLGIIGSLIIIQALPAFAGHYIANEMQVAIPKPYHQAIEYFAKADKNKRIGFLPEYTFWGWYNNSWGYNGSGFLWYGIEQPIISRNFDMWNFKSESYYWELKNAVEAEDVARFEKVLQKYNVDYLLIDHSMRPVVTTIKAIQFDRVEAMLAKSRSVKKEKTWDFLTLYRVEHQKPIRSFVSLGSNISNVGPAVKITNNDTAYSALGDYVTHQQKPYAVYYPFLDLTSQTQLADPDWYMAESQSSWYVGRLLPFETSDYTIPTTAGIAEMNLYTSEDASQFVLPYTATLARERVSLQFPQTQVLSFIPNTTNVDHCRFVNGTIDSFSFGHDLEVESAQKASACFTYEGHYLDQRYGYIVKVQNENVEGQRLFFYIVDKTKEQPLIEDRLTKDVQYYVVETHYENGIGYDFSFQNNAYNTIPAKNIMHGLDVYLLPYTVLKEFALFHKSLPITKASYSDAFTTEKKQYHKYLVTITDTNLPTNSTVILHQSYHPGWHAYAISPSKWNIIHWLQTTFPTLFGTKIEAHMSYNNWANAWALPKDTTPGTQVILLFWPQYLQYLGLVITVLGVFLVIFPRVTRPLWPVYGIMATATVQGGNTLLRALQKLPIPSYKRMFSQE